MTQEELIKAIEELAKKAKEAKENNAAVVLYGLAGTMHSGADYSLCMLVRGFFVQRARASTWRSQRESLQQLAR